MNAMYLIREKNVNKTSVKVSLAPKSVDFILSSFEMIVEMDSLMAYTLE